MDFLNLSSQFIFAFLDKKGAKSVQHIKGGSLYDHFLRVGNLLKSWELEKLIVNAGFTHSLYSTEVFKKALLDENDRTELIDTIGEKAERIVYLFSILDRGSLKVDQDSYSFSNYKTKELVSLDKDEFIALIHILFANDLDHIDRHGISSKLGLFRPYLRYKEYFVGPAQDALDLLCSSEEIKNKDSAHIEFIAHAGIRIVGTKESLAVDPWIYPSTLSNPVLFGIKPGMRTIDYPIPEPRVSLKEIVSDIVLLSHLHTHHSPLREIKDMALIKKITLVCPSMKKEEMEIVRKNLGEEAYQNITFKLLDADTELTFNEFSVRALSHPQLKHFAYFITYKDKSILHVSDALTKQPGGTEFDAVWKKFDKLKPTYMFVSAGSHAERTLDDINERDIVEHSTFSPIQAAKLTKRVMPKNVGLVGIYNFSIWTNRLEYSLPSSVCEEMFFWALSYLAPGIQFHSLKPGNTYPL